MLGVLFVALEDLDASLQEVLELGVLSGRNEGLIQGANDRLMESDLVVDIRLVECGARKLGKFARFSSCCFARLLLVSLSSGVTLSFLTSASALSLTALWSRTISLAKARTPSVLDVCKANSAALMSMLPAV